VRIKNQIRLKSPPTAGCELRDRRGFTLVEMMVAGVLLMTVTMIVVPAIYWVHRERRQTEHRQVAIVEVENMMERVVALPFKDINQATVDKLVLSESALRQLSNADLKIEISETDNLPQMKKIQVQLGWKDHRGMSVAPVRLTSWVCLKENR
jgi:Tfp pilus assembly protein PilE